MFACFVAYFLAAMVASSAVSFTVSNIKRVKFAWFEILAVLDRPIAGLMSTEEKKEQLE